MQRVDYWLQPRTPHELDCKHPDDMRLYALDFSEYGDGAQNVSSGTVTVDSGDVAAVQSSIAGAVYVVQISGGTEGTVSVITVAVTLSNGSIINVVLRVLVRTPAIAA